MSARAEKIRMLRLIPGITDLTPKGEGFLAPGLPFKIPKGVIVELIGTAPKEYAVAFLSLNPTFKVFWCEKEQTVFPPYMAQNGVDVSNVTFGTYNDKISEGVTDVLRAGRYDFVTAPMEFTNTAIDRFARLCRDTQTIFFMFGKDKTTSSIHIDLQLEIHRGETEHIFKHEVLKIKHGRISTNATY